tara:strand:- start:34126 stop:34614 length:489 start_codon:yes stop_codon:yes gene_type:complete
MTVFIQKGDEPLTVIQATNRGRRMFEAQKPQHEREAGLLTSSQTYVEWANQWLNDNTVNAENNRFNYELHLHRAAVARLEKYVLSVGRAEVTEEQTEGDETVTVVTVTAVDPLPATVDVVTYSDDGTQGTATVANPAIVQDVAERDAAQSVIDGTPAPVIEY